MYIPFKWVYFMYIKPLTVHETEFNKEKGYIDKTGEVWNPKGKGLWRILIGTAQGDMNWTYTMEEVMLEREKWRKNLWCKCDERKEDYRLTEYDEPYCVCLNCNKEVKEPSKWENL